MSGKALRHVATALLDTSFFIDLRRGDAGALNLWRSIFSGLLTCSYSVVTTFELWVGNVSEEEADFYDGILFFLESVELTEEAAMVAADLLRTLPREQRERLFRDALIAASASIRGETIYTRNLRDFESFNIPTQAYQ